MQISKEVFWAEGTTSAKARRWEGEPDLFEEKQESQGAAAEQQGIRRGVGNDIEGV